MKQTFLVVIVAILFSGCNQRETNFDATGNFEADEIIISAEATGKIQQLAVAEGMLLAQGATVGYIDTTQLYLRKKQLQFSIKALTAKMPNATVQLAALKEQIETASFEKTRIENLLKEDAATKKQLDDITAQLALLQREYDAAQSTLGITRQSLQSETLPLHAQLEQVQDQLQKSIIKNPVAGTVLTLFAKENEVVTTGKPLYKIADLKTIVLRAYISGNQLPQLKLGQQVTVFVDAPNDEYKQYKGTVSWVSDKAEFTPKTIQTKEERANLVYAVKISVPNDGYLKLGMYGEVKFK